jgi:hypothetical protein
MRSSRAQARLLAAATEVNASAHLQSGACLGYPPRPLGVAHAWESTLPIVSSSQDVQRRRGRSPGYVLRCRATIEHRDGRRGHALTLRQLLTLSKRSKTTQVGDHPRTLVADTRREGDRAPAADAIRPSPSENSYPP